MIILYHYKNKITQAPQNKWIGQVFSAVLFAAANAYPDEVIAWCDEDYRDYFQPHALEDLFHHKKMMVSYQPENNYLPPAIGYVEDSSFIKINKQVLFPTWLMSAKAGGISAKVVLAVQTQVKPTRDSNYFLLSLAKLSMPLGIACYSAPTVLTSDAPIAAQGTVTTLFRFVSQHYRLRWLFLLLLNVCLNDRLLPVFSFIQAFFFKRRVLQDTISQLLLNSNKELPPPSIDVLIPTLGRPDYLYDVLQDLAKQTLLPKKIIITEQNPELTSTSALNYLTEAWPFAIKHLFTHQTGACQARNKALEQVSASWVFLADDDIRLPANFLEQAYQRALAHGTEVVNFSCLHKGQTPAFKQEHQTSIFGAGCSMLTWRSIGSTRFNLAYEFGFSEDLAFARALLDKGFDTIYLPQPSLLHLKAPSGGFRTKVKQLWQNDAILPKPSPTVMLYKIEHHTREQVLGYRTVLFFKYYREQPIKNPWVYFRHFCRQWNKSYFYANQLKMKAQ